MLADVKLGVLEGAFCEGFQSMDSLHERSPSYTSDICVNRWRLARNGFTAETIKRNQSLDINYDVEVKSI